LDHFGIGPEVNGDKIYHGAVDNASGSAALLEIARAYKTAPPATASNDSVPFRHGRRARFARFTILREHPFYSLARTAANINMDGMDVHGMTRDIVQSDAAFPHLTKLLMRLPENRRVVKMDPEPEKAITIAPTTSNLPREVSLLSIPTKELILSASPRDGAGGSTEVHGRELPQAVGHDQARLGPERGCAGLQLYFLVGYRICQ